MSTGTVTQACYANALMVESFFLTIRQDAFLLFACKKLLQICGLQRRPSLRGFQRVAVVSSKNHKRQRRKRQSVTAKREKSQSLNRNTNLTQPSLT